MVTSSSVLAGHRINRLKDLLAEEPEGPRVRAELLVLLTAISVRDAWQVPDPHFPRQITTRPVICRGKCVFSGGLWARGRPPIGVAYATSDLPCWSMLGSQPRPGV